MKKFLRSCFIQINLFLITFIPIIMFSQMMVHPISEEVLCGKIECRLRAENHFIYSRYGYTGVIREKSNLELYEVKDEIFPITHYFIRSHKHIYNPVRERYEDEDRLIFTTEYFIKKNAERDLNILKNTDHIKLTKKNVGLITFLCLCIYIILQSLGIIVNMIDKDVNEKKSGEHGAGEN